MIVLSASVFIGAMNCLFALPTFDGDVWRVVFSVAMSVIAAILIDGIFATIVRWILPKKWFSLDKKRFAAGRRERRFYERLGIKKWKDKVIELGCFTGFRKNRIAEPANNEYIGRYIIEANYGIVVHIACMFCGYLVCLLFPAHWYSVGVPVGFVNMMLNLFPLMILRYNLPKLHSLYRFNLKREKENKTDMRKEKEPSLIA